VISKAKHYFLAKVQRFRGPKVFAFVGLDGSGKTTMIRELTKVFDNNGMSNYDVVYMGRWHNRSGPRKLASSLIKHKTRDVNSQSLARQIAWIVDMYVRYFKFRFNKNKIVVTDRYVYDLLAMPAYSRVSEVLLSLFPSPHITFSLYADPKELASRRGGNEKEIKNRIDSMNSVLSGTNKVNIKTTNQEKNTKEVAQRVFGYLARYP
tara:strand:- start:110 stop:730 length:621 start_codon:yes stop_codon:yes gene_type:complete